jgi:hypothetical protein
MFKKLLLFIFFIGSFSSFAQEPVIEFGKNKINIDEKFFMKLIIKGSSSRPSVVFPEIEGLKKADKPTTTGISLQNGKTVYTHTFIQNYSATKEGTFKIVKGSLKIEENMVDYNEFYITVFDPNKVEIKPKKVEFIEEKDHASFELIVDQSSVYKGEGIHVSLVFNIFDDNAADLEFPSDLSKKIEDFERKLKPKNCWEEKINFIDIKSEKTTIRGQSANQYKLIETTYFPFDNKTITFPALNLEMIKLKVANDGIKKLKITKAFSTNSQSVSIKKLPPHPSENAMLVGSFEMKEILKKGIVETGESFPLELIVTGIGNFNLLNQPNLTNDEDFDFYTPIVKETIFSKGKTTGKKHFIINIVPKKTGIKSLGKYINFIFFDTKKQKYDTLKPKALIEIVGKNIVSQKAKEKNPESPDSIFDGLENEKINAPFFDFFDFTRKITNVFAFLMFCILIFLIVKNPK